MAALMIRRRRRHRRRQAMNAVLEAVYTDVEIPRPGREFVLRSTVWWDRVLNEEYGNIFWRKNFRMSRQTFDELCTLLQPHLQRQASNGFTIEKVIAIALYRLATPCDLRTIANLFGVGRSTTCEIVHEVCETVVDVMFDQYIVWPVGDRLQQTIMGFENKYGFPQCAGAVDGTHIPIIAPNKNPADYHNRKGIYSVVMQAVVDDKLRFTDINVGWPGRVHDARVLRNSSLFRRGEDGTLFPQWNRNINGVDVPVVILGDPAYPLLTWLLKGFSEGANFTREKRNFNYRLSRARMVVERAFGQLKGRWRILMRRNDTQLQKVPKLVTACCVLHNFCIQTNEEYNEEWDDHEEDVQPENEENNNVPGTSAADMRNALLAYFN